VYLAVKEGYPLTTPEATRSTRAGKTAYEIAAERYGSLRGKKRVSPTAMRSAFVQWRPLLVDFFGFDPKKERTKKANDFWSLGGPGRAAQYVTCRHFRRRHASH